MFENRYSDIVCTRPFIPVHRLLGTKLRFGRVWECVAWTETFLKGHSKLRKSLHPQLCTVLEKTHREIDVEVHSNDVIKKCTWTMGTSGVWRSD